MNQESEFKSLVGFFYRGPGKDPQDKATVVKVSLNINLPERCKSIVTESLLMGITLSL